MIKIKMISKVKKKNLKEIKTWFKLSLLKKNYYKNSKKNKIISKQLNYHNRKKKSQKNLK